MRTFILAGGFATRLWPLTESRAKPLLPLVGKPILTHIVEKLPADFDVTVSTNAAFGEDMRAWAGVLGRPVTVHVEESRSDDAKLGTNGAIAEWIANDGIDEDVLLLTGDNYLGFDMTSFMNAYRPGTPLLATHDIKDLSEASKFGTVILGPDGRSVSAFEEKPKEPKSTLISTGCSILPRATLPVIAAYAAVKPDNIGGIFEEFLRRQIAVDAFSFTEPWFDIGSFEAYLDATTLLVGDRMVQGEGSRFEDSAQEGSVVLGTGNTITNSRLTNVVLFDHCHIDNCILENCIIDNDCELRGVDLTGKMLRAKTRLVIEE